MGIFAALSAALFGAFKDILSKTISVNTSGALSAFASFLFALPFYLLALLILYLLGAEDFSISTQFLWLALARSLTDVLAEWSKMEAFTKADLSDVVTVLALTPIFLLFTSPLITGDPFSVNAAWSILLVVSGSLILVYRPRQQQINTKGLGLALCAAFFFSLNNCFDRLAVQVASPVLSGFAMTLLSALILLPFCLARTGQLQLLSIHTKLFFLRGFLEVGFMVAKLSALKFLQAPYVSSLLYTSVLFSIIGGRVVFKEKNFGTKMLAGSLILAGVLNTVLVNL